MTHNYIRTLNPIPQGIPQGMPIIPPRLQLQQQQEVLEKHRLKHKKSEGSFRPPVIQGGHNRSVSNGSTVARPRPLDSNTSPKTTSNNSSYGSTASSNNSGRLRSESNPTYNSNNSNGYSNNTADSYADSSSLGTSIHYRTNSSGSNSRSYASRGANLASRSNTTGSSFQERMRERDREKQLREREERDAVARAIHEDSTLNQPASTTATAAAPQSTGTGLWSRLRAAKDVINATITGEERWPEDSDDSDHEGESHVRRVLRGYADKKEAEKIAARIAELDMASTVPTRSGSLSQKSPLREALRRDNSGNRINTSIARSPSGNNSLPSPSFSPTSSTKDYYGQSLRARGETGSQPAQSDYNVRNRRKGDADGNSTSATTGPVRIGNRLRTSSDTNGNSTNPTTGPVRIGNRFRTSSDASLSQALGRLEGKRNQDALVAQVSHLGSTRARSPHRGQRAYKDNIDVVPPPPLPTPKSTFRQQIQQQQQQQQQQQPSLLPPSSPSRKLNNLGAYGLRKQLQEQEQQQANYI
ncbi:hypothetical protein EDD21DRAFT_189357 [Dissophora ornata]|nr:hypothetical protein EDD21DRAFT_189357 [Dissophora ornata]